MAADFRPAFTPRQMLEMGVFEGKYLNDIADQFPRAWTATALKRGKLRPGLPPDPKVNCFGVKARQGISVWRANGWLPSSAALRASPNGAPRKGRGARAILADPARNPDTRGWFEWYCRYFAGRRLPELDAVQIARWKAFARHSAQLRARCAKGDVKCSPRQRQALLQWAHDPFV